MEYNMIKLEEKIDSFFSGILSKDELGKWAEKAYFDLLRGGYVEIKKVKLYPFLKTISAFAIKNNDWKDEFPCSENDVKEIQKILHGKQDFDFQVELAIPIQVYNMFGEKANYDFRKREMFVKIREEIFCFFQGITENNSNILNYINANLENREKPETIQGILEEHIYKLCKVLIKKCDAGIERKVGLKLYPQKNSQDYLGEKLKEYLDCYLGKRSFNILVSYRNGISEMLVFV